MVRVIILPNGKQCGLPTYVQAWKTLRSMVALGQGNYAISGFGDWPQRANDILAAIKEGVDDRVNIRGGLVMRDADPVKRLWKRIKAGRIVRVCKWCGTPFKATYLAQWCCCEDCQHSDGR